VLTVNRSVFAAEENAMTRSMARGHLLRKGHELKGVWVYEMPGYRRLQRTCCK
jgi:hypothetical protein